MFTEIAHLALSSILNTVYGVGGTRWASAEENTVVRCLGVSAWYLSDACEVLECHKISDAVIKVNIYIDRAREIWGLPSLMVWTVEAFSRLFKSVQCRDVTIGLHRNDRAEHVAELLTSIPENLLKGRTVWIHKGTIALSKKKLLVIAWKHHGLDYHLWNQCIEIPEELWEDRKNITGQHSLKKVESVKQPIMNRE